MTNEQKKYLLDNWKKFTTSELALKLTTASQIVRPPEVHTFLTRNNITPITKRDLITKEVIEIYGNETTKISVIADRLKVSRQLVKDIIQEHGLALDGIKNGPRPKS